jgi:hypothetical protein
LFFTCLQIYANERQHLLKDGGEADQRDRNLEQVGKPSVADEAIDEVEAEGAADDRDENPISRSGTINFL